MIRTIGLTLVVLGLSVPAMTDIDGEAVRTYRVEAVKGKLFREAPEPRTRLESGSDVAAGATVRTGWFSSAEIACPDQGAHFKLDARTRVRLSREAPGLLLDMDQGRLRAWFDALTDEQAPDRVVTTPSAVLAVRGTEYGVSVSRGGDTTIAVFSGVVAVSNRELDQEPVLVGPGLYSMIRRGRPPSSPEPHSMTASSFDRGASPGPGAAAMGEGAGAEGMRPGMPGSGPGGGGSRGSGGGRR